MFKILQTQIPIPLFWHNHLTDNSPSLSHNINIIIIIFFIVVNEKDGIADDFQNLNFYMDCWLKTLRKKKKRSRLYIIETILVFHIHY